jgi:uncharacterized protein YkwD
MMTHTVSPRAGDVRLRTICVVAAVLAAYATLFSAPALAATGRLRTLHRLRRAQSHTRRLGAQSQTRRLGAQSQTRRLSTRAGRPHCADAHAPINRTPGAAIERATICLLNHERTERDLPRLRSSRLLRRSAQEWTNAMVHDRAFSHGTDFSARITAVGFNWSRAGENIADGYRTAAGAVTAWMRSLGHCQNILTPVFREAGAGFDLRSAIRGGRRGTWTLDLALGMGQRAPSQDWGPAEGCPYPH